jgi:flagellin
VQAANDTNGATDRTSLEEEFIQLGKEIDRTLNATKFNGTAILANTSATPTQFQVGAGTNTTQDVIDVAAVDLTADANITTLTGAAAGDLADAATARGAIDTIDAALDTVNSERATFGAIQNRFDSVIANLQVTKENTEAARSRIMDADFAAETAALTRAQILQQAGTAMLAQANAAPQSVLSLLRG